MFCGEKSKVTWDRGLSCYVVDDDGNDACGVCK